MNENYEGSLGKVRLRFQVLGAGGELLWDRLVSYLEATAAAEEQSKVAREILARGEAITLLVTDPDEGDAVLWRALWLP